MVISVDVLATTSPRHTPVQMCFKAGRVRLTPDRVLLPRLGLRRRDRVAETPAPVGPQEPPARRAARLVAVATRARGSLLWTTGTSCALAGKSRSRNKHTACHNRSPS